jgi:hypothetical protein
LIDVKNWFAGFGTLRLMLIALIVLLTVLGPFSGGTVNFDGFALITTLVAPVMFAILVFVLPLELTMAAVFRSSASSEHRAELKRAMITETVLFAMMMLAWIPFILKLLRVR